jgi:hypothetical protein
VVSMKLLRILPFSAVALMVVSAAHAEPLSVPTDPVGYQTTSVPLGLSALANPLVNANTIQSSVAANTASVVTFNSVANVGALLTAGEPYYIEVSAGPLEGERFDVDTALTIAAANSTLVLNTSSPNNTLPSLSADQLSGSTVAVRKHVTLSQLQSAFSPSLIGSNNLNNADQIQLFNPGSGSFTVYYLRANGTEWRAQGSAVDDSKRPVPPGVGFLVRKITSTTSFTSVGSVRMNDFSFPMPQGLSFRAPGYPVSYSPSSLGGTGINGWTGNNNLNNADQLQVFNSASGSFTTYYLRGNGTEWRAQGGSVSVTSDQLFADNVPFMVLKRQADPNYILINPVVQ